MDSDERIRMEYNEDPSNYQSIRAMELDIVSLEFVEWVHSDDGEGDSEEVHILIEVRDADYKLVIRIDNPALMDAIISTLATKREAVWPRESDG